MFILATLLYLGLGSCEEEVKSEILHKQSPTAKSKGKFLLIGTDDQFEIQILNGQQWIYNQM